MEDEEGLRIEKEKQEKYNEQIGLSQALLADEKYEAAIEGFQKILDAYPDDKSALNGIEDARKLMNSCNEIIGNWQLSHGPKWVVKGDNTVDGKMLIFSAKGAWECLSAKNREFVVKWPDHGWIDYFQLSVDARILNPIRTSTITGTRIGN